MIPPLARLLLGGCGGGDRARADYGQQRILDGVVNTQYPSGGGRLIVHVNKVHHVTTINRVAKNLGENEDWLFDVATEMDIEDGVIWVYGAGAEGVMAFIDFGIENLIDLIKIHKDDPTPLKR